MQGSKDELSPVALPAHASMWHANLPDISQRSVNAAAKAAALASVGDKLVDSLQAQSLDLPPQAAKVLRLKCKIDTSIILASKLFAYALASAQHLYLTVP